METKMCVKCGLEKNKDDFYKRYYKKTGKIYSRIVCKKCECEQTKKYVENNKEKVRKFKREWQIKNEEKLGIVRKRKTKNSTLSIQEQKNQWRREKKKDPIYKLKYQTSSMIRNCFVRKNYKKTTKTMKILGCDYQFFISHLLKTYKDNYGIDWDGIVEVEIDHIYPLSKAQTEEEVIKLCHYSNLQLLTKEDNRKKRDKIL